MATIRAMVTLDRLIEAGVHPTQARNFLEPLQEAAHQFGIDTPARFSAFLAQAMHESAGLTRLEEGLSYRTPERIMAVWPSRFPTIADAMPMVRNPRGLANRVYAGRMGNGDEASGDGWRFRGRGIFQLTGRDNYRRAGIACGRPYESAPDVVADPRDACLTAGWFWSVNDLNMLADAWNIRRISTIVNRGPGSKAPAHGEADRLSWSDQAMQAFA
jgi:putative chitinase